jgi:hypothetical protein
VPALQERADQVVPVLAAQGLVRGPVDQGAQVVGR